MLSSKRPRASLWSTDSPWYSRRPSLPPDNRPGPSLYCAVIVKRVDEQTRRKTSINDLLRDT